MTSIDLLLRYSPPWVNITDQQWNRVHFVAMPQTPGGRVSKSFYLELGLSKLGGARVTEQENSRQCPPFCLERHINPDSSFCVGLDSEAPLANIEAAASWWSGLGSFLVNQVYAERHGVWPLSAGLSHGDAARVQLEMETLADSIGWKDDILRAMFRGKGWLAERLPRINKTQNRVVNGRSPCPRGCTRKHGKLRKQSCEISSCTDSCRKIHKRILRVDCPSRDVIEKIIMLEHRRRRIETKLVGQLVKSGKSCCGTMNNCALRTIEN